MIQFERSKFRYIEPPTDRSLKSLRSIKQIDGANKPIL